MRDRAIVLYGDWNSLTFSLQWRERCRENGEYEATVAAHNEPMQRQLAAGAADPAGRCWWGLVVDAEVALL